MAELDNDVEQGSFIRVNRLGSGAHSWTVTVAASCASVDALRLAKETAVALVQELEAELSPPSPVVPNPF